jgi:DNA-binding protein HU-beta
MYKMNKTDLVNVVAADTEVAKKDVEAVVNATLNAIANALKDGDKVQLIGFGNFEVKEVAAREGRNPKTGEAITIEAGKKPAFSASKVLKDLVNA